MIVIYSPKEVESKEKIKRFIQGKEYYVLGIIFSPNGSLHKVSIQEEYDGTPVLIDISLVKIVDGRIPQDWCINLLSSGAYSLEPVAFIGDFWDRFHDGDEEAEIVFYEECERIKDFHITE